MLIDFQGFASGGWNSATYVNFGTRNLFIIIAREVDVAWSFVHIAVFFSSAGKTPDQESSLVSDAKRRIPKIHSEEDLSMKGTGQEEGGGGRSCAGPRGMMAHLFKLGRSFETVAKSSRQVEIALRDEMFLKYIVMSSTLQDKSLYVRLGRGSASSDNQEEANMWKRSMAQMKS